MKASIWEVECSWARYASGATLVNAKVTKNAMRYFYERPKLKLRCPYIAMPELTRYSNLLNHSTKGKTLPDSPIVRQRNKKPLHVAGLHWKP